MFEIKVTFYSIYCELATTKNYGKFSSHYPHVYKTKWWHLHGIYEKLKIIVNNNFLNLPRTFSKVAFFTRKTWAAKLQLNYHYYYNYYLKKTLWCNPRSRPSGVKIHVKNRIFHRETFMEIQADKLFFRQKENSKTKSLFPVQNTRNLLLLLLLLFFLFLSHLLFHSTTITVIITKHTCTNGLHT